MIWKQQSKRGAIQKTEKVERLDACNSSTHLQLDMFRNLAAPRVFVDFGSVFSEINDLSVVSYGIAF